MTIDDLLDYDVDALVERTKDRALPRGAISIQRAWAFFALQVFVGLYSAFFILKRPALFISAYAWPLYIIYPTCKRWMDFAPVPLGLMFNIGIFMGWSDLNPTGKVDWFILIPVFLGCVFWTISYETIYQHQDRVDDVKIGLRSLAIYLGENTTYACLVTSIMFTGLVAYGGFLNGQHASFFIGIVVAGMKLVIKVVRTNIDSPTECKSMFMETPFIGLIVLAGLVSDGIYYRLSSGLTL